MVAAAPPLDADEVLRVLRLLAPVTADPSVVLVGGQAVAYWARILGLIADEATDALLASKDIDFEGDADAARAAAELVGGRARLPSFDHHTPLTGVVFFDDGSGNGRRIDFLLAPFGLDRHDVRDTAIELDVGTEESRATLWIMHPERVMESRIANVQTLGIDDPHAMAQLRASISVAREWSRQLLGDEPTAPPDRVRAVLRLNERIFRKCVGEHRFRQLFSKRGVDPFEAVLVHDDRLPDAFRARRYPQMVELLNQRRAGE